MLRNLFEKFDILIQLVTEMLDQFKQEQNKVPFDDSDIYISLCKAACVHKVSERQLYRWKQQKLITPTYFGAYPFFNKITLAQDIKDNKLSTGRTPCKKECYK